MESVLKLTALTLLTLLAVAQVPVNALTPSEPTSDVLEAHYVMRLETHLEGAPTGRLVVELKSNSTPVPNSVSSTHLSVSSVATYLIVLPPHLVNYSVELRNPVVEEVSKPVEVVVLKAKLSGGPEEVVGESPAWVESKVVNLGGVKLLKISVDPLKVVDSGTELLVQAEIEVSIKYLRGEGVVPEWVINYLGSKVVNPSELREYYRSVEGRPGFLILVNSTDIPDYLREYALIQFLRGYDVSIVKLRDLLEGRVVKDIQSTIREYLREVYAENLRYLLIVGNEEEVPPLSFPGSDRLVGAEPYMKVTDDYYAFLDGDWDPDRDGTYLENVDSDGDGIPDEMLEELPDEVPELIVGRVPLSGAQQKAYFENLIDYYLNPREFTSGIDAAFFAAIVNYENEGGEEKPKFDAAEVSEAIIQEFLRGSGWVIIRAYEEEGLDPSEYRSDEPLTYSTVRKVLRGGVRYAYYSAHGIVDALYRKVWTSDDGDGVAESGELKFYPFVDTATEVGNPVPRVDVIEACLSGAYDLGYSLAEHLLISGSGAVVAATRIIYYDPGWDPGGYGISELSYLTFRELATGATAGEALYTSKSEYLLKKDVTDEYYEVKNVLTYTLLGDPTFKPYPKDVNELVVEVVKYLSNAVVVKVSDSEGNPVSSASTYLLTSEGEVISEALTDAEGSAVLNLREGINSELYIGVSKEGYAPDLIKFQEVEVGPTAGYLTLQILGETEATVGEYVDLYVITYLDGVPVTPDSLGLEPLTPGTEASYEFLDLEGLRVAVVRVTSSEPGLSTVAIRVAYGNLTALRYLIIEFTERPPEPLIEGVTYSLSPDGLLAVAVRLDEPTANVSIQVVSLSTQDALVPEVSSTVINGTHYLIGRLKLVGSGTYLVKVSTENQVEEFVVLYSGEVVKQLKEALTELAEVRDELKEVREEMRNLTNTLGEVAEAQESLAGKLESVSELEGELSKVKESALAEVSKLSSELGKVEKELNELREEVVRVRNEVPTLMWVSLLALVLGLASVLLNVVTRRR